MMGHSLDDVYLVIKTCVEVIFHCLLSGNYYYYVVQHSYNVYNVTSKWKLYPIKLIKPYQSNK